MQIEATKTKAAEKLVNYVNPSFKQYNRPVCLAITVIAITYATCAVIFAVAIISCDKHVVVLDQSQFQYRYDDLKIKCVDWTAVLLPGNEVGSCKLNLNTFGGVAPIPDITYCKPFIADRCSSTLTNPIVLVGYEQCPALAPTLGSALGYASTISGVVATLLVAALVKTGTIKVVHTEASGVRA